jgi:hypothetical protein
MSTWPMMYFTFSRRCTSNRGEQNSNPTRDVDRLCPRAVPLSGDVTREPREQQKDAHREANNE